jgi:hypothetical protein
MRRWILFVLAAICFPGLAHSDTAPSRVILVAQDVPTAETSPQNPAAFRVVAQVVDEPTCWQLAKLVGNQASAQVFFCVSPESLKPDPTRKVPPILPRGKTV